ncbi:hypothetical protein G7046_g4953 [Stylonectria norvegica]|nr:hypothetical protein G7046_g4953 [Stylonectria norvegica]
MFKNLPAEQRCRRTTSRTAQRLELRLRGTGRSTRHSAGATSGASGSAGFLRWIRLGLYLAAPCLLMFLAACSLLWGRPSDACNTNQSKEQIKSLVWITAIHDPCGDRVLCVGCDDLSNRYYMGADDRRRDSSDCGWKLAAVLLELSGEASHHKQHDDTRQGARGMALEADLPALLGAQLDTSRPGLMAHALITYTL